VANRPQPWYAALNQPPRSPKDGRNRRPNPPTHRSAFDRTDHSPRADDAADAYDYSSWNPIRTYTFSEPTPPTIPHAGIRAGELIGHRMWLVLSGNQLCSLAHYFIWEPNATIEGDINERVNTFPWAFMMPRFGGVYSYFTAGQVQKEFHSTEAQQMQFPAPCILGDNMHPCIIHGIAYGTIKCWGEVVEHEHGWRAQYAKLTSIDGVIGYADLPLLRSKYNV